MKYLEPDVCRFWANAVEAWWSHKIEGHLLTWPRSCPGISASFFSSSRLPGPLSRPTQLWWTAPSSSSLVASLPLQTSPLHTYPRGMQRDIMMANMGLVTVMVPDFSKTQLSSNSGASKPIDQTTSGHAQSQLHWFVLLKKVEKSQVNQPSELSHQMQQCLLGVDLLRDLP